MRRIGRGSRLAAITRGLAPPRAQEVSMIGRVAVLAAIAVGVAAAVSPTGRAQSSAAIGGRVTSIEEGPMEGVLVSAKRAASTITVTVVSDAQGRYRFPVHQIAAGHLCPSYSSGGLRPGWASERGGQGQRDHDGRSETDARSRSRVATLQLGVARQLSGYRAGKGVHPRVRALPHAGAGRTVPLRRRRDDEGDRAHVRRIRSSRFP